MTPVNELTGAPGEYDPLVRRARDATYVLLGEASHGTHEFYSARAEITKRLISEERFTLVAVDAGWPDAYRVNCFVRGASDDRTAEQALSDFRRFPSWMWRNADVAEFVTWLREYNDSLPVGARKVGFYGLDLYSTYTSMEGVVRYLEGVDPGAAARARERYSCFGHFGRDPHAYARETLLLPDAESCEGGAVEQLVELRRLAAQAALSDQRIDGDRQFYAEQNARLVVDAERHYRAVYEGGWECWNRRDRHMSQTLDELVARAGTQGARAKAVVWEHNAHIGDARATDMAQLGQLSVGQLTRERHARDVFIAGFTTYTGTVTAASDWGGPAERKHVLPALPGSWEQVLHEQCGAAAGMLIDAPRLDGEALERAIGVVYRPQAELLSHYFHARLGQQFDAVVHIDETRAVEPLERTSAWDREPLPEP